MPGLFVPNYDYALFCHTQQLYLWDIGPCTSSKMSADGRIYYVDKKDNMEWIRKM